MARDFQVRKLRAEQSRTQQQRSKVISTLVDLTKWDFIREERFKLQSNRLTLNNLSKGCISFIQLALPFIYLNRIWLEFRRQKKERDLHRQKSFIANLCKSKFRRLLYRRLPTIELRAVLLVANSCCISSAMLASRATGRSQEALLTFLRAKALIWSFEFRLVAYMDRVVRLQRAFHKK